MTKTEIIDRLVEEIREKANKMTVKQLKDLMGRNDISIKKKSSKKK